MEELPSGGDRLIRNVDCDSRNSAEEPPNDTYREPKLLNISILVAALKLIPVSARVGPRIASRVGFSVGSNIESVNNEYR